MHRSLVLSLAALVVGVSLVACGSDAPEPTTGATVDIEGVQTFDDLSRDHTTDAVDYAQSPPVGGEHDPQWLDCTGTVYAEPVRDENAVHALEHGAVWITYSDDLASADVDALADRVAGQPYTFMSPYPEQGSPIVLTGWGVQLSLDDISDERVDEFLTAYRQGPQTPEPGATCEAGAMS